MRYIIRTSEHGKRKPAAEIEEKKLEVKARMMNSGRHYLEFVAVLGTLDPLGNRIEEQVLVIEEVGGDAYV